MSTKKILLLAIACLYPLVELAQGYIFGGDISKSITNSFAVLSILALAPYTILPLTKKLTPIDITIAILIALSFSMVLVKGLDQGAISYDLNALIRSLALAVIIFTFCKNINNDAKIYLIQRISRYTWGLITLCVFISYTTGIGLHTYIDFESGNKFYFPSINELTFVYISSWIMLSITSKSTWAGYATLAATIATFLILGNKSFIPLIIFYIAAKNFLSLSSGTKLFVLPAITIIALILHATGILNFLGSKAVDAVVYILSNQSQGAEKFLAKLSYLDITSALISERDMLLEIAFKVYTEKATIFTNLFGMNLTGYGTAYGQIRNGTFSFSENDAVDLFMSYGLAGVTLLIALCIKVNKAQPIELPNKKLNIKGIYITLFVFNGILTGHIFLFTFTCLTVSIYSGLLSSNQPTKKTKTENNVQTCSR